MHGVFHGDLHGGNLFVLPDGRTALLDFGITGRLDERKRLAFLRLLVLGSSGDVRGQLAALRDLGAFPPDTDLDAVIADLGLDQPVKDPTLMSADELVGELRDLTKKLLEYGARAPKELMLFVKNMMFLDGATATLAPDLDIIGEIAHVYLYFQEHYGDRIAADLGPRGRARARPRLGEGGPRPRRRCRGPAHLRRRSASAASSSAPACRPSSSASAAERPRPG